jgi:hypothetical protein
MNPFVLFIFDNAILTILLELHPPQMRHSLPGALAILAQKNKSNRTNDRHQKEPMKRALCLLSSAMENVWSAFWKNFAGQPYCSSDTQKCKRSQKIHIVCGMM